MPSSFSALPSLQTLKPVLLVIGFCALVVAINFQPDFAEQLRYERASFGQQWWQGLSHALPHVNLKHMWLNVLALLCMAALFPEAFKSFSWLFALAFSAMASATGLYFFSPAIDWCIGLSGALHGLMIYVVLHSRANIFWLLAIASKLIVEQTDMFADSGIVSITVDYIGHSIVIDAHLWGAMGGFVYFLLAYIVQYIVVFVEINSTQS